jgi:hypothetical protein
MVNGERWLKWRMSHNFVAALLSELNFLIGRYFRDGSNFRPKLRMVIL